MILYFCDHMLHRKKSTTEITKMYIAIGATNIPLIIYREYRRDWRISLGKKTVNLRIPNYQSSAISGDPIEWAQKWIYKKYEDDPALFYHFLQPAPYQGKNYQTLFGDFKLDLRETNTVKARGKIVHDSIQIVYPIGWNDEAKKEVFPKIISRLFALRFRDDYTARVNKLNEKCFNFNFNSISFKYNTSNWGSCSSKGNLNFSTRLFLAPLEVSDYVIVHELAHLSVPNHSAFFWKVVSDAMPEYETYVEWLKLHGQHLYY